MDSFKVPGYESRRVLDISSCTIEWVGTYLTYIAVVARGTSIINILVFKHNENKLRVLYTINLCPELANPERPELNPNQSYKDMPFKVKLSVDAVFLAVTMLNGAVNLLKMPPILNPLNPEQTINSDGVGISKDEKTLMGNTKNAPTATVRSS